MLEIISRQSWVIPGIVFLYFDFSTKLYNKMIKFCRCWDIIQFYNVSIFEENFMGIIKSQLCSFYFNIENFFTKTHYG